MVILEQRKKARFILLAIALLTLSFLSYSGESLRAEEVSIFYTADILGQIEPIEDEDGNTVGGAVRLGYIISSQGKELDSFLLLDAGNAIGPDPFVRFSNGLDQIKIMNQIGYTAMALGEMEFMYGPEALKKCIEESNFPLLSANVVYQDTGKYFSKPYSIYNTSDGLKVGITAVTDADIPLSAYGFSNIEIDYPSSCLSEIIDTLKTEKGCDLVVVLSNLGEEEDKKLVESIQDIDIIIGSSARALSPSRVYQSIPQDIDKGVSMFYCTPLATTVGKISLEVEKDNSLVKMSNIEFKSFYLDKESCPPDFVEKEVPELKEFVEKDIIEPYKSREEVIIGAVKEGETIKLTDLVLLLMQKKTDAEFALCDRGLFGWFLKDVMLQGKIKEYDIDEGIPYSDDLILVKMTGSDILDLIDYHEEQIGTTKELLFSSGFDPASQKINGRDIDDYEEYIFAVNNYLASQGAGYTMFGDEDVELIKDTDIKIRDLALNYIKEKSTKGQKLSLSELKHWAEKTRWKYRVYLSGGLDVFSKGKNADLYSDIDEFSSPRYYEWEIGPAFELKGWSKQQSLDFTLSVEYGKGKYFPEDDDPYEEEVEDSIDADLDYRRFVGEDFYGTLFLELDDLQITPEEDDRKGYLSTGLGIGYEFSSDFDVSFGVSAHNKLFVSGEDYGLYLKSQYQEDFNNFSLDIKGYVFHILKLGQLSSYSGITPAVGDYTVKIEGDIEVSLTDTLTLDFQPFLYYDKSVGDWAWSLSTSLTLELDWGLLS